MAVFVVLALLPLLYHSFQSLSRASGSSQEKLVSEVSSIRAVLIEQKAIIAQLKKALAECGELLTLLWICAAALLCMRSTAAVY